MLSGQVNNIQMITVDASMASTMENANTYMKQHEMVNEKLNDIILDQREHQAQQAETNHLFNEMAQGDGVNEDEEDLFRELEMEVEKEKKAVITQQMQHHQIPQVAVVQQQASYAQQKQVYAPMSTTGGQQYAQQGLASQYKPQPQSQPQQSYGQPQQYQQQYQQAPKQYKAANHMD